ncbi:hypothetical protein HZU75_16630 [Chitinibacter fontanus]|uniref:Uncharacterized protein n=1 Tax=Chitinibacter fontanus TaxID=1737446 RepID=A0A7D5VBG8_9NEIS|nr:hypothetical protein [Chitinibacter fontanus]QLI83017.1 hypothetical protein HZU75_16630 [Chitinibacter fontanus]
MQTIQITLSDYESIVNQLFLLYFLTTLFALFIADLAARIVMRFFDFAHQKYIERSLEKGDGKVTLIHFNPPKDSSPLGD